MTTRLSDLFFAQTSKAVDKWEHYLPLYEAELGRLRQRGPLRLLEIGVQNGGSLELWARYLPAGSRIVGFDIEPAVANLKFDDASIEVYCLDALDEEKSNEILGESKFDIIIDDGSHISKDIIESFKVYSKRLDWSGVFILEDLHACYHTAYGGGLRVPTSGVEWLKGLIDVLNRDHWSTASDRDSIPEDELAYGDWIKRVSFFDSFTVVEKLPEAKTVPYARIASGSEMTVASLTSMIGSFASTAPDRMLLGESAAKKVEQGIFQELAKRDALITTLQAELMQARDELARFRTNSQNTVAPSEGTFLSAGLSTQPQTDQKPGWTQVKDFEWAQAISEDDWLNWLLGNTIYPGRTAPPMPNTTMQSTFVGASGFHALKEAQLFLNHVSQATQLPSNPKVLDFACGWGRLYRVMLRWSWNIVGADSEPVVLQTCQENLPGEFHLINNRPPYPFADGSFDLVYAYSLFSHLPENVAVLVLNEFARVLKPGGYVAITLLDESEAQRVWSETVTDYSQEAWQDHKRTGAVHYLGIGGGFESMKEDDYGWAYVSPEALSRILRDLPFELAERTVVQNVPQDIVILRRI